MIIHFKITIISIKSGIPWTIRNPVQKSFIVLVGEAVAIPPIKKANGGDYIQSQTNHNKC